MDGDGFIGDWKRPLVLAFLELRTASGVCRCRRWRDAIRRRGLTFCRVG